MFSKEESKHIRQQFWIFFGKRYPRKWLLYNTKIKDFSLKFDFDNKRAIVAIDSTATDEIFRAYYFDKLLSLKTIMKQEVSEELIFDDSYVLDNQKVIARCYLKLEGVSIHNKHDWPTVFEFFYLHMDKMETFFLEYQDFIKS